MYTTQFFLFYFILIIYCLIASLKPVILKHIYFKNDVVLCKMYKKTFLFALLFKTAHKKLKYHKNEAIFDETESTI